MSTPNCTQCNSVVSDCSNIVGVQLLSITSQAYYYYS